jgi:hypothetical protein
MWPVSLPQFPGATRFAPVPKLISRLRHRVGLATPAAGTVRTVESSIRANAFFVTSEVPMRTEVALSLGVLAMRGAVLAHFVIGSDMDD